MFETTLLQVAKACDLERKDNHEHTTLGLITQTMSNDNKEEEKYDWSEKCDVAKELEKNDNEICNLSKIIAKKDETIAQLNSKIKRLMSEKDIEKDVQSSYVEMLIHVREKMICDKLKKEETMHKKLKEHHKTSDERITSLQESLKEK
ncbi:hypothetical protein QVD17_09045 [Tagetes erecta]|uniref:Uncharacterized protein n=1 Tax=Tagetes erecta TaxID=13708 RepID=A0AAD8P3K2_TARER|nr:hypothetical protein QVD17_09045 [Tagetes erecta]